jgi:hypothetical protein
MVNAMANEHPQPNGSPTPTRLEREYTELFSGVPQMIQQAQDALSAMPAATSGVGVVVRTYTTYSAYEDPIEQ